MYEVELSLTKRLVLGLFHDLLAKVSKLCVNPAVCLDVNKPVEIVSLRHSCSAACNRDEIGLVWWVCLNSSRRSISSNASFTKTSASAASRRANSGA